MINELLLKTLQHLKVLGPVSCSSIAGGANIDVDISSLLNQIPYNCLCLIVINASNHSNYNSIIVAYIGTGYIHTFPYIVYSNNITVTRVSGTKINIKNNSANSTNSGMKIQLIQLSF